jgi:hypothetical protein
VPPPSFRRRRAPVDVALSPCRHRR